MVRTWNQTRFSGIEDYKKQLKSGELLHIYCNRCGRELSEDEIDYSDEGEELCYLCVEEGEDE